MAVVEPTSVNCVIYHANCTDGFGAAYSAWKLLGNRAEYHACHHGKPPPDVKDKVVAILDFSYKNDVIRQMAEDAKALIVIDHHKTAMVELHDFPNTIFDMSHSGTILAWKFFHPGKEAPKFLEYIEDRDLWTWQLPYSREFNAAFDMVPFEFEEFEKFEDDSVFDDAVKRGSYILAYSKTVIKKICENATRKKLDGKDVLVVNSSHWVSEIGNKLGPDCDFALIWYYNHNQKLTKVSLRAFHEHIDVSEVAKKFGGGGHKPSSGFVLSKDQHIDDIFDSEEEHVEELENVDEIKEKLKKIKEDLGSGKKIKKVDLDELKGEIEQIAGAVSGSA